MPSTTSDKLSHKVYHELRTRILTYVRKRNIKTILDFMNRRFFFDGERAYDQDGTMPSNTGQTTCVQIREIQKKLVKENEKELKKVPVTKYEWKLV